MPIIIIQDVRNSMILSKVSKIEANIKMLAQMVRIRCKLWTLGVNSLISTFGSPILWMHLVVFVWTMRSLLMDFLRE
jgi:hypothetical protein